MQRNTFFPKIPLILAIWSWILMGIMHLTYPDHIGLELGLSYFGLSETVSGNGNLITSILFNLMICGMVFGFAAMAWYLSQFSLKFSLLHGILVFGLICILFPFDRYKSIHDFGAIIVYLMMLSIAIRISTYAFRNKYRKWVEATMLSITSFMTIMIVLFIGFFVVIVLVGGILQKIYLLLFFVVYAEFQIPNPDENKISEPR